MPIAPDGTVQIITDLLAGSVRTSELIHIVYAKGERLLPTRVWEEHYDIKGHGQLELTTKEWGKGRTALVDALKSMIQLGDNLPSAVVTMSPAYQPMYERGVFDTKH